MRIFLIILASMAAGAYAQAGSVDNGAGDGSSVEPTTGYKYDIHVRRTGQTIAPAYPVLYMYYQVQPSQNLTYFNTVHSFWAESFIEFDGRTVYENSVDNSIPVCTQPKDGTWEYFIAAVITDQLLPNNRCPIEKGSYTVHQDSQISVTFNEKIMCGEYFLIANVYDGLDHQWAAQMEWDFDIPDDGNCIPPKSR